MKLLNFILTTLVVDILGSWVAAIYFLSQSDLKGMAFYAFAMLFGNMFIPILLTVWVFSVLKKHIDSANRWIKYLSQTGLALTIMAVGVCIGTISGSISYAGVFSGLAPGQLRDQFNSSYKGYIPIVLLVSFLIPVSYYWVFSIRHSSQN
jgi:hypothetical protein